MKQYHELATIKDGNRRAGYIITNSQVISDPLATSWQLVSAEQFEELVKNNRVQYLVYDNGTIKCRYTDEEKESLHKMMKGRNAKKFIEETEQNYFNMDCVFRYDHITLAQQYNDIVAGTTGDIVSQFGIKMIMLYFVGSTQALNNLQEELMHISKNLKNLIVNNGTALRVLIPVLLLNDILIRLNINVLINTSTLKYIHEQKISVPKIKFTQFNVKDEVINDTLKILNNITDKNMIDIKTKYNIIWMEGRKCFI
jgi:hypothetical protein